MMSHSNIQAFYQLEFSLKKHHGYSITEINDMYPFERDLHVTMIHQHIEKENQRKQNG